MEKIDTIAAGSALAVTFAVMSLLCALAFWLWPNGTLDFFGAFMHGVDLTPVKSTAPLTLGRVLYGVVGLAVAGFVAGAVFARAYNLVCSR